MFNFTVIPDLLGTGSFASLECGEDAERVTYSVHFHASGAISGLVNMGKYHAIGRHDYNGHEITRVNTFALI